MHRSIGVVDLKGTNPCIAYGEDQSTLDNFFRKAGAYVNLWITLDPPASSAFDALMVMKKHPKFNNYQTLIVSQIKKYEEPALPQFDPNQKVNRAVEASQILTETERLRHEAALKEKKFVHWLALVAKDPGNGHFVHTPLPLAKEMIDKLGELHNKKILVMFNLEFIWELVKAGVPTCNIWYIADNEYWHAAAGAMKTFKGINNIAWAKGPDAMSAAIEETGMKFDVVIGNPPYQSGESETKKLWQEFIKTLISKCQFETLALVTPNGWFYEPDGRKIAQTTKAMMTGNVIFAEVSGRISKEFFPGIGEDIGYWVWSKEKTPGVVIHRSGTIDDYQVSMSRPKISIEDIMRHSIQSKLEAKLNEGHHSIRVEGLKGMQWQAGPQSVGLQAKLSPIKTDVYSQAVRITPANTMFCEPHTVTRQWGVCFTNSGYYYKEGQQDKYMPYTDDPTAQNFLKITVDSEDEAAAVYSHLKSKLYVCFVMKLIGKAFNDYALARLPFLGRDKIWTDQELYQHFNLTQEEIDYIESVVK